MRNLILFLALIAWLPSNGFAADCKDRYQVQKGDDLAKIALKFLGDKKRFREIHEANARVIGSDPNKLEIGVTLNIPCTPAAVEKPVEIKGWKRLVGADVLNQFRLRRGTQILDIRPAAEAAKGTIAGAVSVPFPRWRRDGAQQGQMLDEEALANLIGSAGLRLDRPIVIVQSNGTPFDTGRAAYVYWVLRSAGADKLAILQGGFDAWQAAKLPTATVPAQPRGYKAKVTIAGTWRASRSDVMAIAARTARGALVDSRPVDEFSRQDAGGQSVPTTLPNALSGPVAGTHMAVQQAKSDADGVFAVLSRLKAVDANWERDPVVAICNTGELSALNWFYASEIAGIRNVKLYPEAITGWVAGGGKLVSPN